MKPLRVEMQAFGPYAARQVLDFAALKHRQFFLIHGPTGSGKTTVLDAMVFALYGTTSGAERDATDMRSDSAPPSLQTEVVFDFAIGADRYRVHRIPAQDRPKLRGEGFTTQPQDATLWRLATTGPSASGDAPVTDGKPLASGWSKVTAKAIELLGFRAEQFRQVVMLPQGRFQELLKADSAGREEILATLFGTQYYARLERELKEAAAAGRKELERLAVRRETLLATVHLEAEEQLAPARARLQEACAAACAERERLDSERAEAEAAKQRGLDTLAKLQVTEQARQGLRELEARQPEMDLLRHDERLGRAAAAAEPAARRARDCAAEREAAAAALNVAQDSCDTAAAARSAAAAALQAENARTAEREDAQKRVAELEGLHTKVTALAAGRRALEDAQAAEEAAARRQATATGDRDQVVAAREAARTAVERAAEAAADADARAAHALSARAGAENRRKLDDAAAQEASTKADLEVAEQAWQRAAAEWTQADEQRARLEQAWADGQAAVLAAALEPGSPCPVCGSLEHPHPAAAAAAAPVPDAAQVAAARAAATAAHQRRDEAAAARAAATAVWETRCGQTQTLRETLGAACERPLAACSADAEAAEERAAAAARAMSDLPDLRDALDRAAAGLLAAEAELVAAQAACSSATEARSRAAAQVDERAAGLPDGLHDAVALDAEIGRATAAAAALTAAYAAAVDADHAADVELGKAQAALTAARQVLARAEAAAVAAAADFGTELAVRGFGEVFEDARTAWETASAPAERLDEMAAAITAYDEGLAAARGRAQQAEEAAAGLERLDMDSLTARAAEAAAAAQRAADSAAQQRVALGALDEAAATLADMAARNAEVGAQYAIVGHLAKLANGENSRGLTLQRFVLGALLDAVLVAASHRLRSMSKSRYQLVRTDDRRGGRRAAGLDLDVYDAWTGRSRPVSTLSGGESFLAALALALGLAETVQARSGGIYLDTVFVDEGFGTLDDEALDLAIATLMELQQGDRLVGIISHVSELKERIDARLEVTADQGLSRARFVAP